MFRYVTSAAPALTCIVYHLRRRVACQTKKKTFETRSKKRKRVGRARPYLHFVFFCAVLYCTDRLDVVVGVVRYQDRAEEGGQPEAEHGVASEE